MNCCQFLFGTYTPIEACLNNVSFVEISLVCILDHGLTIYGEDGKEEDKSTFVEGGLKRGLPHG
jgi:hypothetical protein